MKSTNHLKVVLAAFSLIFLLTSCSGKTESVNKQAEAEKAISDTPAELVFYSNSGDSEKSFDERFGDALRKKFPNFTIKYIQAVSGMSLEQLLVSGVKFDIFFATNGNFDRYLLENNLQKDMTDLIKSSKTDISKVEPLIVNPMKQNMGGKLYGLPIYNNVMVLYYNKAIFDKFGVTYPKDGMTWDEALSLGNKLTRFADGKPYIGLSINPNNTISLNQFSLPSVDPKTEAPSINSNANWRKVYDKFFIQPFQTDGAKAEIKRLKKVPDHANFYEADMNLAMYAYQSGLFSVKPDELRRMDMDIVSLPTFTELPGVGSQPYPVIFGITSISKNENAAMKAIEYLISDELQMSISKIGMMPVSVKDDVKKAFGSESAFKDKHLSSVFYNKLAPLAPIQPYSAAINKIYETKAPTLAQGDTNINDAFRAIEEEAQKAINTAKSK